MTLWPGFHSRVAPHRGTHQQGVQPEADSFQADSSYIEIKGMRVTDGARGMVF